MKVKISKSTSKGKKMMAVFYDDTGKKVKTTHFGAEGYTDFTKSKDEERKKRYLNRHKGESWNSYMTAGSLSRYILWNKLTLSASIADYKRRFKLKGK